MLDRSVVGSDRRIGTALSRFITAGTSSIRWELALRPFAFTFISLLLDFKLDSCRWDPPWELPCSMEYCLIIC
nr:hypothetical protein Q903MT_gene6185 [Picea sitchensis]